MIEFAIIATFLFLLMSAVIDLGLAWRRSNEVSSTLRSATRVVANFGADGAADFQALTSLNAGVAEIGNANVQRVIVYKSTTPNGAVPQNCLDKVPSSSGNGVDDVCNVYSRQQLASLSAADFTLSGAASCPSSKHDHWYCPADDREDRQSAPAGADYVGIWMEVQYTYVVGMLPGTGITIKDKTVMRIEPRAT